MRTVCSELDRQVLTGDGGWSEKEALRQWTLICGPTAISSYINRFLVNEMKLTPAPDAINYQDHFGKLFTFALTNGMPTELLQLGILKNAMFQARNAEEALFAALNACSRATNTIIEIVASDPTAFGAWLRRIQGQRTEAQNVLALFCLSNLRMENIFLHNIDLHGADLSNSDLSGVKAAFGAFDSATMANVTLEKAWLMKAGLEMANLRHSNLRGANLKEARLEGAQLLDADLEGADLSGANLRRANLTGANLQRSNLSGAHLEEANLTGAKLKGADTQGANLSAATGMRARGAIKRKKPKNQLPPPTNQPALI